MKMMRRRTELAKMAAAMMMAVGRSGVPSGGLSVVRVLVGRRLSVVDGTLSAGEVVTVLFVLWTGPTDEWQYTTCVIHNSRSCYSTFRPCHIYMVCCVNKDCRNHMEHIGCS